MVFCNIFVDTENNLLYTVTILILIDGFLQYNGRIIKLSDLGGHNPYFNRWFSAIGLKMLKEEFLVGHNPYFNRWFSAM